MSGYVKIWTDIFNDEWFTSLSLTERGMWFQLITYCKLSGDTSRINLRSFRAIGALFGCDGKTAANILRKFCDNSALQLDESNGIISIYLPNYEKHQRLRKPSDRGKVTDNSATNKIRLDKIKEDKVDAPKNPAHKRMVDYFCQKYQDHFEEKYSFKGGKDGQLMARLLKQWGEEKLKVLIDNLFSTKDSFIIDAGRTVGVLAACDNKLAQESKPQKDLGDRLNDIERKLQ